MGWKSYHKMNLNQANLQMLARYQPKVYTAIHATELLPTRVKNTICHIIALHTQYTQMCSSVKPDIFCWFHQWLIKVRHESVLRWPVFTNSTNEKCMLLKLHLNNCQNIIINTTLHKTQVSAVLPLMTTKIQRISFVKKNLRNDENLPCGENIDFWRNLTKSPILNCKTVHFVIWP